MRHRKTRGNIATQQPDDQSVIVERTSHRLLEADISVHIFSVSAALVGVCLTVIGVVRIVSGLQKSSTFVDDFLAVDAVLFLLSCLLSYWALRTRSLRRMYRIEHIADALFLVGLTLMVLICGCITYVLW